MLFKPKWYTQFTGNTHPTLFYFSYKDYNIFETNLYKLGKTVQLMYSLYNRVTQHYYKISY